MATTFYVDTNGSDEVLMEAGAGTEASPYTTIKQALNAAEALAESATATKFVIQVGAGTYNCSIDMEDYPNLNSADITVTLNGPKKGMPFPITPGSVNPETDAILNMGYLYIYATNMTVDGFTATSAISDDLTKPMIIVYRVPSAAQAGNVAYTEGTDNTVRIQNNFFTIQANESVLADASITNPFRTHTGGGDATIKGGWAITEIKVEDEGRTFIDGNGFKAFTQSNIFPPENKMDLTADEHATCSVAIVSYNPATAATFEPTGAYSTIVQSNMFMTFGIRLVDRPVSISLYRNFFLHVLGPAINLQQAVDVEITDCHFTFVGMCAILYKQYSDNEDAPTEINHNRFQYISSTDFNADAAVKDTLTQYHKNQLDDQDAKVGSAIMLNGYGGIKDSSMSNMEFLGVQGAGVYVSHDNGGYVSFATVIKRFDSSSDEFAAVAAETGTAEADLLSLPGTKRTLANTIANNWVGGYGAGNNANYNADDETFWTYAETSNPADNYYSRMYCTNFVRLYNSFAVADPNTPGAVQYQVGSLVSGVVDIRQLKKHLDRYEIGFFLGNGAGGNNQVFPAAATNADGDTYVQRSQTRTIGCGFVNVNGKIKTFIELKNNPLTNKSEIRYGHPIELGDINGGVAFHLEIDDEGQKASMGILNPIFSEDGVTTVAVPDLPNVSTHSFILGSNLELDIDTFGTSRPVAFFHLSGSQALVEGSFFAAFADPAPAPGDDDVLRPRPFYCVTTDVTSGTFWGYAGAAAPLGGAIVDELKYPGGLGVLRGTRINFGAGVGQVATALGGWNFAAANNPATAESQLVVYDSTYGLSGRANSFDNPLENVSSPNNAIVFGEYRPYAVDKLFTEEESGGAAAGTTVAQLLRHAAGGVFPSVFLFLEEKGFADANDDYAIQMAGAVAAQIGNAPTASRRNVTLGTLSYFNTQNTMAFSLNELSPNSVLAISKVIFGIHPSQSASVYGDMIGIKTEANNSPKVALSEYFLAYNFPTDQVSQGNVTVSNQLSDTSTIELRSDIIVQSASYGQNGVLASAVLDPGNTVLLSDIDLTELSGDETGTFLTQVYNQLPGYGTVDASDWTSGGPATDSSGNPSPEIQLRFMSDAGSTVLPVGISGYEQQQDPLDLSNLFQSDGTIDATVSISNIPDVEGTWKVYDPQGQEVSSSDVTLTEKVINDTPGLEVKIHTFPTTPNGISYYVAAIKVAQLSDWNGYGVFDALTVGNTIIRPVNNGLSFEPASVNPYPSSS